MERVARGTGVLKRGATHGAVETPRLVDKVNVSANAPKRLGHVALILR